MGRPFSLKRDDLLEMPNKVMSEEERLALHEKHPDAIKRLEREVISNLKEYTVIKRKEEAPSIYGSRPMDENNSAQSYKG